MNNFETKISQLIREEVKFSGKERLREKLVSEYTALTSYESLCKKSVFDLKLSVNARVLMKEKLLMFVYSTKKSIIFSLFESEIFKRGFAFSLLMIFLFGLVVQPFSSMETVKAYTPTKITTFSGSVSVVRSGELVKVENDFVLLENDVIQTGPNAYAEIVFADDSLARISNGTRVVFTALDNKVVNSNTELDVLKGEVWINTFGLAGNQSKFKVNSGELATYVKSSATFDIEVQDNFVRVVALENNLNLELYKDGAYVPTVLKKGELVKVKKETLVNSYLDQVAFEDRISDFNLDWIASNYKQDQFYLADLSENRIIDLRKKAGITPDSYFYPIKEVQRAARLAMTFDPIKQVELELYYANQKLIEAEVLLDKGDKVNAKKSLERYSKDLTMVAEKVSNLDIDTPANQEDVKKLKEDLVASVSIQKKSLAEVLPIEDKYEFKQIINQAELIVAETPADKKKVELTQLNEILAEAKLLAESNMKEIATESLAKYLIEVERISSEFASLDDANKSKVMSAIIESNLDGLAALEAIKKEIPLEAAANTVLQNEEIVDFGLKIDKITEISKENLTQNLVQANELKSPVIVEQVNKINTTIDLNTAARSVPSVIKVESLTDIKTLTPAVLPVTDSNVQPVQTTSTSTSTTTQSQTSGTNSLSLPTSKDILKK